MNPARICSALSLRYGSGQRKTKHALMSETSVGKPQPEAIPLNILSRIHGSIFRKTFRG